MKEFVFVTSSDHKAREAAHILGVNVKRVSLDIEEIQSMDLKEIVEYKARQAYATLKRPVLVEDVGFYIKQWNGWPGPFIRWMAEYISYDKLVRLLDKKNRGVEYVVLYGFFDGKKVSFFKGKIVGTIAQKPRGKKGWGFDVVLIPKGHTQTYAQMGMEAKSKISARSQALRKVKAYLKA